MLHVTHLEDVTVAVVDVRRVIHSLSPPSLPLTLSRPAPGPSLSGSHRTNEKSYCFPSLSLSPPLNSAKCHTWRKPASAHGARLDPLLTIGKESRSHSRAAADRPEQSNCKCKRGGLPLNATFVVVVVVVVVVVPLCRPFEEV